MAKEYTSDSISVLQNLDHIRQRPRGYIAANNIQGQIHTISEVLLNSVDEATLQPEGGTIFIGLFRNRNKGNYQIVILDGFRGIPSASVLSVTTKLGASGKISEKSSYVASGGQFGFGLKVPAALSSRFRLISHNYLETKTASVYLQDGKVVQHDIVDDIDTPHGVTTFFELDLDQFFVEGREFMESGYLDLASLCKHLNIFNEKIDFKFFLFDRSLPEDVWNSPARIARETVFNYLVNKSHEVVYDSSTVIDKTSFLFDLWRVNSSIIFQDHFHKDPINAEDRLGYTVRFYVTKKSATGNPQFYVSVNNVTLPDKTDNSATVSIMQILKAQIADKQPTEQYKQFVLDTYRFPTLLLAVDIKYHEAELSGITKTSFKDQAFAKQFTSELLMQIVTSRENYWDRLIEILQPDIEIQYSRFYDAPVKKNEGKKVFVDLNFPNNYMECKSADRDKCELYIVEGTSAGNIVDTRSKDYQAVYQTRGKPLNAATFYDQIPANRQKLLKDPIYQDLMKIINVSPNTTDMSSTRFSKIIIATDADPDGYHIRSLHLNNLYIINPNLIEQGLVWLANPPLYSMEVSKNKKLFLRDKVALIDSRIEFLYGPSLDIKLVMPDNKVVELDRAAYRDLCYLVDYVGDKFSRVAQQLNIPLLILERLVFAVEYLYPRVDYLKLAKCFESCGGREELVKVQVNEYRRYLVVSVGCEDFIIGLDNIGQTIVNYLLPTVKKYLYRDLFFLVRSKHKGSNLQQEQMMSMMMLYICMQKLNDLFKLRRYKGLGQMTYDDAYVTIMDPSTRSLTHITNIGDAEGNYALIGSDSTGKKQLLTETGVLSTVFLREHNQE